MAEEGRQADTRKELKHTHSIGSVKMFIVAETHVASACESDTNLVSTCRANQMLTDS